MSAGYVLIFPLFFVEIALKVKIKNFALLFVC